jgi:hypothetical protein
MARKVDRLAMIIASSAFSGLRSSADQNSQGLSSAHLIVLSSVSGNTHKGLDLDLINAELDGLNRTVCSGISPPKKVNASA